MQALNFAIQSSSHANNHETTKETTVLLGTPDSRTHVHVHTHIYTLAHGHPLTHTQLQTHKLTREDPVLLRIPTQGLLVLSHSKESSARSQSDVTSAGSCGLDKGDACEVIGHGGRAGYWVGGVGVR